jgi:CRP/FNR family transcriptional regulator, anaerobic regulatory protein
MPDFSLHRSDGAQINVRALQTACSNCSLRELCLPAGLNQRDLDRLDSLVGHKRAAVKRSDRLYRTGEPLDSLFAVRSGFLKSSLLDEEGREQVIGFHMMGELLGMDAIGTGKHVCHAVALEDTEVCEIPFNDLEQLTRSIPDLQHHFHRIMSREIARDYGVMLLLGNMRAEERLAAFLLNLSQRFAARGYSATRFHLRMSRYDIGSYLGLKLETISRAFSRLQEQGMIVVDGRSIELKNLDKLFALIGQPRRS